MKRRALLIAGSGTLVAGGAGVIWLCSAPAPVAVMADWDAVGTWLDGLEESSARTRSGWSLPEVLHHLAQSIEYSMDGYPEMKPAWFRGSLGALAGKAFQRAGAMRHGLDEPIPGAPPLVETTLPEATQRLRDARDRFVGYEGSLRPHFAYGPLDHAQYTRAHLMHIADHSQLVHGLAR